MWALEYPALGPWVLDGECEEDEDQRIRRSLPARTEPLASWKHEQPSSWSQRKSNKDGSSLWSMPSHCKKVIRGRLRAILHHHRKAVISS